MYILKPVHMLCFGALARSMPLLVLLLIAAVGVEANAPSNVECPTGQAACFTHPQSLLQVNGRSSFSNDKFEHPDEGEGQEVRLADSIDFGWRHWLSIPLVVIAAIRCWAEFKQSQGTGQKDIVQSVDDKDDSKLEAQESRVQSSTLGRPWTGNVASVPMETAGVIRTADAKLQKVECSIHHLLPTAPDQSGVAMQHYFNSLDSELPAVSDAEGSRSALSHKALHQFLLAQAKVLEELLGPGPGVRLMLVLEQSPMALLCLLSCFTARISLAVPMDPKSTEQEFLRAMQEPLLGLQAVITTANSVSLAASGEAGLTPVLLSASVSPASPVGSFSLKLAAGTSTRSKGPQRQGAKLLGNGPCVALMTSGTTGQPKWVEQPATHILLGAKLIAGSLQLTIHDRQLGVMPLHHIGGIVTGLASLVSGGSLLYAEAFEPSSFCKLLAGEHGGEGVRPTWYYASPTIHHAVARAVERGAPDHDLRLVRSGAAALPPSLNEKLARLLGCKVLPTSSMTECMPVCGSLPDSSLPLKSVGPPIGPSLRIAAEDGGVAPKGQVGEVQIQQDSLVTPGYLGVERSSNFSDDGWLRTGDLGCLDDDGNLEFTGRSKEVINRAGETLSPACVEDALLRIAGVDDAMAFAVPSNELGEIVGAAVVRAQGKRHELSLADLWRQLENNALRQLWPEVIIYMDCIPKGRTGKKQRLTLAREFASKIQICDVATPAAFHAAENSGEFVFTTEDTGFASAGEATRLDVQVDGDSEKQGAERTLECIWRDALELPGGTKIDWEASFWSQGGRSTQLAAVAVQTRDAFGLQPDQLPLSAVMAQPNLRGLARALEFAHGKPAAVQNSVEGLDASKLLVPLGAAASDGSKEGCPIVITVTGRQSAANRMGPVALLLPETRCFSLEKPARGVREHEKLEDFPPETAPEMVAQFAAAIAASFGKSRPIVLLGTSMGGLWAFAVGVELQRRGVPLARLVLLDSPSPMDDPDPYTKQSEHIKKFFAGSPSPAEISTFFQKMATRKYAKGVLGEDQEGWEEKVLRFWIWDADAYVKLLEHCAPREDQMPMQLRCPIAVFRASEDKELYRRARDDRDWMQFTSSGPFEYEERATSHEMFLERFIMQAETDTGLRAKLERLCKPDREEREGSSASTVCPWQRLQRLCSQSLSVIDENECSLPCGEVVEHTERLATLMSEQGVEAGTRVMVVGIVGRDCLLAQLALMHCGAAAVLIGAGESKDYLATVAEMSGCSHALSLLPDLEISDIPFELAALKLEGTHDDGRKPVLPAFVQRKAPATILFSSGSTGKPKGVVQSYDTLLALASDMAPSSTPLLWKGSIGWIANYALPYVLAGQPLLVVPRDVQLSPTAFKDLRRRHQIRTLTLVPSELRGLLETPDCLSDLESVTCMAEALPPAVSIQFFRQYPHVQLMETYASSEVQGSNAFLSTEVSRDGAPGCFNVRPGQTVILVDPGNVTRKVDTPQQTGELLLRPTANGYLDGKQTSIRFLPNPFGPGTLFRTGDLCKWLEVGKKVQLVGRVDFQVKVAGKLVELEHVEKAAESLPGVRLAAARTFVRASGTMVVAVYLTVDGSRVRGPKGERAIKEELALKLPSHAVPAIVSFLDQIPLLKNGKKDRKSLPEPDEGEDEDMTDSLGMVRAVGARWAQEFRARQAFCGVTVLFGLVLHHWHLLSYPFPEALDVVRNSVSVNFLIWSIGYMDGRLGKTGWEFFVQNSVLLLLYFALGWPIWLYGWTGGRYMCVQRWSLAFYVMIRVSQRVLTTLRVPLLVQGLAVFALAPLGRTHHLGLPPDLPHFAYVLFDYFFEQDNYVLLRDAGNYFIGFYIGTIATQSAINEFLGRSAQMALAAGVAWFFIRTAHHFSGLRDAVYDNLLWYPLELFLQVSCAILGMLCIGEGNFALRMLGRYIVGTYLVHLTIRLPIDDFVVLCAPAGTIVQAAVPIILASAYIVTVGAAAQYCVNVLMRSCTAWST
eukprot:TRINITY_DN3493_c0_g1_i1.p1 TRINITY_DN3493_c0_g1~~TRINITY_DN3493_c0_g1_i1.p1  ORF type:complete len:1979 (+),score=356.93 TRINITY_DN3493_c0_g1_i1:24-5960(+)